MCGRTTFLASWADIHAFSQPLVLLPTDLAEMTPTWNFAPTQTGPVIVAELEEDADARIVPMRWGLVPAWAKDMKIGAQTINARVETVATKPSFRSAWQRRRCLVPASGYYEWPVVGTIKQPYFIHPLESPLLFFAGLWEQWKSPDGAAVLSYSIITRAAQGGIASLHDRMPLALEPGVFADWLLGDAARAQAIVDAAPPVTVAFHPVARAVGSPRNNHPALIDPVALDAAATEPGATRGDDRGE
jgi:putative SOS response-associated peptidase YedK